MTIYYPDIASYQAGIDLSGARAVSIKATEGTGYFNPYYPAQKAEAAKHGAFQFAYHFLTHGSAAAQAAYCYSKIGKTPAMLDVEPTGTSRPTVADATVFVDAFRKAGGVMWLVYFPRWYWEQLGRPSLAPLADRGMSLVSSAYTGYTDASTGTGWQPYGGMTPAVWQYTNSLRFNGYNVDFNAYRGSKYAGKQDAASIAAALAEFRSLVSTGKLPSRPAPAGPPPPNASSTEDYNMIINPAANGPAIALAVPAGKTRMVLSADPGYRGQTVPDLRVAFSPWNGEHKLQVKWPDGATLTLPKGAVKATIARLDTGAVPVDVAWA